GARHRRRAVRGRRRPDGREEGRPERGLLYGGGVVLPCRGAAFRLPAAAAGAGGVDRKPHRRKGHMRRAVALAVAALLWGCSEAPRAVASDEGLPVREVSLEIRPGSPLDFSAFLPNRAIGPMSAIGADRRVVARADGRLAFADTPEEPARRVCASRAWSPAS